MLVIGVKGRIPGLYQVAHISRKIVLSAQGCSRDRSIFGDGDTVGDGRVDPVFDRAKRIGVRFEERDCFEGCCTISLVTGTA